MKKTTLLLLQVFLVFTAYSCLISGGSARPNPEDSAQNQLPSDFELWAQGKMPSIQLTSGQESLTNFREHFNIQINGEAEDGTPFLGSLEYLIENDSASDKSRELENIQTPSRYLSGAREWVVADGYTYLVRPLHQGGLVCEKNENPPDPSHFSNVHVTRILLSITPGDLLEQNVRVQDVPADVYAIEGLSLLFVRQLNSVTGKVWIAQQPSYFLKAEGNIAGVFEFENIHYNGEATFSYELKDFNQVQVQLPALCAHPPKDLIPLPANAQDVQEFPGLITYSSPDPVDMVMSFYLNELISQGWQVGEPQADVFEEIVTAQITTDQGIQLAVEIKIVAMTPGSYVQLAWQAQ